MGGGGQSEGHQSTHSSFSPRLLPLSQEVIKGALERSQQEHSRGVLICSGDPVWKEVWSLEGSPWGGAVSPHLGGIVKAHLNVQMRANLALAGSP